MFCSGIAAMAGNRQTIIAANTVTATLNCTLKSNNQILCSSVAVPVRCYSVTRVEQLLPGCPGVARGPGTLSSVMLKLDLIQTLAFAGVVLFVGYGIRRLIAPLARYNIPAPVVGGLLLAAAMWIARSRGGVPLQFDTTLQAPLMIAFFTSVGFGASLSLLKVGGPLVAGFLVLASAAGILQNLVGMGIASAMGEHPLLGVLTGSVTMMGGPATGLAFAPLFEEAGVAGAATIAVAAAMAGIVAGGLAGGPVGTFLIERGRLRTAGAGAGAGAGAEAPRDTAQNVVEDIIGPPATGTQPVPVPPKGEDVEAYGLLKTLVMMLVAMALGTWVSKGVAALGVTLPAYIGAMLVAAAIRNLDDHTRIVGISQRTIDDLGTVALSLFLVMALMTLKLWELAGLALPLAVILVVQVAIVMAIAAWVVYRWTGRNYDAAVMASGFVGFMLGTTANAMANMGALVEKFGPSPRAFLVVPIVGAFFIDFTNALIITAFVNLVR
jgi:ESS family glutamate:Na+ symporter